MYDSLGDQWNVDSGLVRMGNSSGHMGLTSTFAVPMCQKRTDGWTGTMVTDTLRYGVLDPSFKNLISGRSIRYGPTTKLSEDPNVNHPELVARTGHAPPDNSKHYILSNQMMQYVPMRSLAGYTSVRTKHSPPRLRSLGSSAAQLELMETFADKLYPTNLGAFQPGGTLRQVVREVLATNIMNFNDKLAFLGAGYETIKRTVEIAEAVGIDLARLKEMSRVVKTDFDRMNPRHSAREEELQATVAENNRLLAEMSKELANLRVTVNNQNATITQLHTELQQERVRALLSTPPLTPKTSRRRTATTPSPSPQPPSTRRRTSSPARSPVRVVTAAAASSVASVARAVAAAALPRRAQLKAPLVVRKSSSGAGSKKRWDSPEVGRVLRELANTGQLHGQAAFRNTIPPPSLFPKPLEPSEMTKYRNAMKAAELVITDEHERLLRAKDTSDGVEMSLLAGNINRAVIRLVSEAEGIAVTPRMTARVFGLGNRIGKLKEGEMEAAAQSRTTTCSSFLGAILGSR